MATAQEMVALCDEAIRKLLAGEHVSEFSSNGRMLKRPSLEELRKIRSTYAVEADGAANSGIAFNSPSFRRPV